MKLFMELKMKVDEKIKFPFKLIISINRCIFGNNNVTNTLCFYIGSIDVFSK